MAEEGKETMTAGSLRVLAQRAQKIFEQLEGEGLSVRDARITCAFAIVALSKGDQEEALATVRGVVRVARELREMAEQLEREDRN